MEEKKTEFIPISEGSSTMKSLWRSILLLDKSYKNILSNELSKMVEKAEVSRLDRRKSPQIELSKVLNLKEKADTIRRNINEIEKLIGDIKENDEKSRVIEKNILEIATYMEESKPSIRTARLIMERMSREFLIDHIHLFHKLDESILLEILKSPTITNDIEFFAENISVFEHLGEKIAMWCLSKKRKDILLDHIDHFKILNDYVVRELVIEGEVRFIAENKEHFSYKLEHSKHNKLLINMAIEKIEKQKKEKESKPQGTLNNIKNPLQEKVKEALKHGLGDKVIETFLGKEGIDDCIVIKTIREEAPEVFKRNIHKIPALNGEIAQIMIKDDPQYVKKNIQIFQEGERPHILKLYKQQIQEGKENTNDLLIARNHMKYGEYSEVSLQGLQGKEVSSILNTLIEKREFRVVGKELPLVKNVKISVAQNLLKNFRIDILAENIASFEPFSKEFADEFRGEHYNITSGKRENFSRVLEEYPENFGIN